MGQTDRNREAGNERNVKIVHGNVEEGSERGRGTQETRSSERISQVIFFFSMTKCNQLDFP